MISCHSSAGGRSLRLTELSTVVWHFQAFPDSRVSAGSEIIKPNVKQHSNSQLRSITDGRSNNNSPSPSCSPPSQDHSHSELISASLSVSASSLLWTQLRLGDCDGCHNGKEIWKLCGNSWAVLLILFNKTNKSTSYSSTSND